MKAAVDAGGGHTDVVSLALCVVKAADGTPVPVDKTSHVAVAVLYEAVSAPGGAHVETLAQIDEVERFLEESFSHGNAIGVADEAVHLLPPRAVGAPGVISGAGSVIVEDFAAANAQHRFPEREGSRGGIAQLARPR